MNSRLTRFKPIDFALPCSFSAWTCKLCCDAFAHLGYFYSFIRITGWFDSSIRLTPAHGSFTTAKVPQSSRQNTGSVNGCYCCSHAHTRVPISPRVCLLSNNRALPCRNTLKHFSLSLSNFTSLLIKLSTLCVTHPAEQLICAWMWTGCRGALSIEFQNISLVI